MLLPLAAASVLISALLYVALRTAPAHAHGRSGHQLHLSARFLRPTSRVGTWAVWTLVAGAVAQPALAFRVGWGGAPFGALATLLALVALARHQDRSPLVPVVLVVGLFGALLPVALWAVGGR